MEREKQVNFMLQRSAAFLLSDRRTTGARNHAAQVNVIARTESQGSVIPFFSLLLTSNLLRHWPLLKRLISSRLQEEIKERPVDSPHLRPAGVDWARTAEQFANGEKVLAPGRNSRRVFQRHRAAYWLLRELQMQADELLSIAMEIGITKGVQPGSIFDRLKVVRDEVREFLGIAREQGWPCDGSFHASEAIICESFRGVVRSRGAECLLQWESYLGLVDELSPRSGANFSGTNSLSRWRRNYCRVATVLGAGSGILVEGTTEVSRLYELWCCCELINFLYFERGLGSFQLAPLDGTRNLELLAVSGLMDVTYNFTGLLGSEGSDTSWAGKILRRSVVEWCFTTLRGRKVVFDTKFSQWSSEANLTVLGYLQDFDADVAVVVFAGELKSSGYIGTTLATDRIVIKTLHDGLRERLFVAMSLTPDEELMELNFETLRNFCDRALGP